jgi:drug/metabolite transporter (DMT)-like permease
LWIVIITFFRGEKLAKLAILGLTISFSGVCVIFYDHLSDFLQPDFRFGILLSFIATISWAFGSLYTKKAATFNPYFSLGLQMLISSLILLLYWCNWNWSQFNVNSNFMVVHCLPCNYRIYIVFYCLHLHAAKSSGRNK